jgi:hypothetical protein
MYRNVSLIFILLLTINLSEAQESKLPDRISFNVSNISLEDVLQRLTNQYSLSFFYSPDKIPLKNQISIVVESMPVTEFITLLCTKAGITYKLEKDKVILLPLLPGWFDKTCTISGFVIDSLTGERLIGASITFPDLSKGIATNAYGYYSFTLPKGNCRLRCSYMGYVMIERNLEAKDNQQLNIFLKPGLIPIREIKLSAKLNDKISSVRAGEDEVPLNIMKNAPLLLGENDVLQFMKMMPGIQSANEASNGLFIRGCTPHQTSFVLDDAPLFNLYHISGWFSAINPDALKEVKIYKSHLPAKEGGALSTIADLRLRDGNNQKFVVTGGIGTITSRLTVEGPIARNKASFIISARRSYLDQVIKFFNLKDINIGQTYFYDFNAKLNYTINQRNKLYFSGYRSQDFLNETDGTTWGNKALSYRWNHVVTDKLFSNLTITGSNYKHQFQGVDFGNFAYEFSTRIRDYTCKFDFTYYSRNNNKFNFGINSDYQDLLPLLYKSANPDIENLLSNVSLQKRLINTAYAESDYEISKHLSVLGGLRLSWLHSLSRDSAKMVLKPQPSLSLRYKNSDLSSIKVAYSRNYQFNHGASVFGYLIPFERYLFTDAQLVPQYADHFSAGYFHRFGNSGIEVSIESYYSSLKNQYRFTYGNEIIMGKGYQSLAIAGEAKAYGVEYSLRKLIGRFTGFLNYTLAKVDRKETNDNQNQFYNPYYDRRHNLTVSGAFELSKKVSISASWVFMSGNPYNLPVAKYEIKGTTIPLFDPSQVYTRRMPSYRRIDAGVQFRFAAKKHYQHCLNFSIYNVLAQQNDIFYSYRDVLDGDLNKDQASKSYDQKRFNMISYYLFQFVPAFSYEFKFY